MPTRERALGIDGRDLGGDQSYQQRRHREAMARNTSPKGSSPRSSPRADVQPLPLDDADWDHEHDEAARHRARRLLSRSSSSYHRLGDGFGAFSRWLAGERWVKRLAIVIARVDGDLRRMFWRAVVAARRRPDQSRYGDAMARRGDRGKYRPRQYRRGRRHPDRARRPHPRRGANPRHHRQGSRPRHRGERAEGRSAAIRHGAVDGAAARRKPQSGGCDARGAHHAGWLCHGLHRRQCAPARNRRDLEARAWRTAVVSAGAGRADDRCIRAVGLAVAAGRSSRRRRSPTSAPRPTECWPASTGSTA